MVRLPSFIVPACKAETGQGEVRHEDASSPRVPTAVRGFRNNALEVLHEYAVSAPVDHVVDIVGGVGAVDLPLDEGLREEVTVLWVFPELVDVDEVLKVPRFDEVNEALIEEDREISLVGLACDGGLHETEAVVETDYGQVVAEGVGGEPELLHLDDAMEDGLGDVGRLVEGLAVLCEEVLDGAALGVRKVVDVDGHFEKKSFCV